MAKMGCGWYLRLGTNLNFYDKNCGGSATERSQVRIYPQPQFCFQKFQWQVIIHSIFKCFDILENDNYGVPNSSKKRTKIFILSTTGPQDNFFC